MAATMQNKTSWTFSDHLAHKCCKLLGICSKPIEVKNIGEANIKFPNKIKGNGYVNIPLEMVVSDNNEIMARCYQQNW